MVEGHITCNEHHLINHHPSIDLKDACNFLPVNTVQKSVNREVCRVVCSGFGSVIGHQRIHLDRPEFFQPDGVHLSNAGKGRLLSELDKLDDGHRT